jgi:site-specific DNA-methyltransferase (adenine-specific)
MTDQLNWRNQLFFGDNLEIMRHYIADESVDLIYTDPPWNSKASYNVLFKEKNGTASPAQITAFEDTWHWDQSAESAYWEIVKAGPSKLSDLLQALRKFLGTNDMMAYVTMMAVRLVEMWRVLKPTGSIYLHCDPTASHYLKLGLDALFGFANYRNEIIWKRTSGHSDAQRYGRVHDVILFYAKSPSATWNQTYQDYNEAYVDQYYRYQDPDGRRWMSGDLSATGLLGGGYEYEWKGITRVWRCPRETMEQLDRENRVFYTKNGVPRIKRYLDESKGLPVQDVWTDIEALRSWHEERIGYPTQKPEGVLERIMLASSNEGDLVLDPFCGCGSTIAVAEKIHRRWVGIDVTHLAIGLMVRRLVDTFREELNDFEIIGDPKDLGGAEALAKEDRHQFEWWCLRIVEARPAQDRKKGADHGIDGVILFADDESGTAKRVLIQVKSGHVGVAQVRDLKGVLDREKAEIGALITLQPPTVPMKKEAVSAGYYEPEHFPGKKYPRLQILTVEDMLREKELEYPRLAPESTFKQAKRQRKKGDEQGSLLEPDED